MSSKDKNQRDSKPSDSQAVDDFMAVLNHPMKDLIAYVRQYILTIHPDIGEEIYWNAPCFFYTGNMLPFKPKEYKRYIVGFNLFKKDCVRLIFLRGANVENSGGLLEGDYKDGRRLVIFKSIEDVKSKEADFGDIILELVDKISNENS